MATDSRRYFFEPFFASFSTIGAGWLLFHAWFEATALDHEAIDDTM
jgi:hypothetical protein